MNPNFDNEIRIRTDETDGVGPWTWPALDEGVWEGPRTDWEDHHKKNIQQLVKKFDVVVQAGGACGVYPRLLSDMFKTVYTFEPDYLSFHCLVNNCQKPNIIKFQAALGNENKLVRVKRAHMSNVGEHHIAHDGPEEDIIIPTMMIDQLGLTACDFIYLDIEGYEAWALTGAERTIQKYWPVIACENPQNVRHLLEQLGYEFRVQSMSDGFFVKP